MFTATTPLGSGALPDLGGGGELSSLLGAPPAAVAELPCRTHRDPDLWFAEAPVDLEQAKQLCAACPLRAECLASALARHEPWGVWGGEIVDKGVVVPRKRPRGRPSKAAMELERREREAATAVAAGGAAA